MESMKKGNRTQAGSSLLGATFTLGENRIGLIRTAALAEPDPDKLRSPVLITAE